MCKPSVIFLLYVSYSQMFSLSKEDLGIHCEQPNSHISIASQSGCILPCSKTDPHDFSSRSNICPSISYFPGEEQVYWGQKPLSPNPAHHHCSVAATGA